MTRGKFITIEGGEGAGKSTNIDFIQDYLEKNGISVVVTREPGGTELSEQIRHILLDNQSTNMSDDTELLLMFAARAQHIKELIVPSLQEGKWVVCDRFTDATYAYQGGGRGMDMQKIAHLEEWVQGNLRPDLTIILDLPVEIGMHRAGKRSDPDRFESENHDFFNKVRDTYLTRAKTNPSRYAVIDAAPSLVNVQQQLEHVLGELVAK